REGSGRDRHHRAGRDYIHAIGLYLYSRLHLIDRHPGRFGENLGEQTVMAWIEVLDQHKRHSGVHRQGLKELLIRVQTSRGRTDRDDGKRTARGLRSASSWFLAWRRRRFGRSGLHLGSAPISFSAPCSTEALNILP